MFHGQEEKVIISNLLAGEVQKVVGLFFGVRVVMQCQLICNKLCVPRFGHARMRTVDYEHVKEALYGLFERYCMYPKTPNQMFY